jgi:hypothetical protein
MRSYVHVLAVLGLGCVPGLLRAEDTYTIKLKKSAKGDISSVVKDEKLVSKIQGKQGGDTVLDDVNTGSESFKFKEEVLAVDDKGHALKMRRKYEKAQKTKEDDTDDYFIQGKTIIIEKLPDEKGSSSSSSSSSSSNDKKPKKFKFTTEDGKEITGDDATPLDKEFNQKESEIDEDEILLPSKPVALDQTWDIKRADELFKEMVDKDEEVVLDLKNAKGTGKLTKVYKKDDCQYGVIEYKLTVPVKTIGGKDIKFKMDADTLFTFSISMDTCIDGKAGSGVVTSKFGVKGKGKVSAGGTQVTVEIDIQGDAKDVIDEEKK